MTDTLTHVSGPTGPAHRGRTPPRDRIRSVLGGLGQTLITFGVIVLLFVVYEVYVTDVFTAQKQNQLQEQIETTWAEDEPTVQAPKTAEGTAAPEQFPDFAIGEALAKVRIPALGADWVRVIVQGTENEQLAAGPGHYPTTALPGEIGNFGVAGHRVGKGSPFLDLDRLRPGDAIVIETRSYWYVYRVIGKAGSGDFSGGSLGVPGQQIVLPTDGGVLLPVPGRSDVKPTHRLITITTCHPKFSAAQRLILHGIMQSAPLSKAAFPLPVDVPALAGR